MLIEKTTYIEVDEQAIIKEYELTKDSDGIEIRMGVGDYVDGLDDSEYYLIGEDEQEKIVQAIKKILGAD